MNTYAQISSSDASDPLSQTQALLKNQAEREKIIQNSPQAMQADQRARQIGGDPENTQGMYDLSASLLGTLSAEQQGDPQKMAAQLDRWQNHPEEVIDHMTPDQKQKLKSIADQSPLRAPANADNKNSTKVVQP